MTGPHVHRATIHGDQVSLMVCSGDHDHGVEVNLDGRDDTLLMDAWKAFSEVLLARAQQYLLELIGSTVPDTLAPLDLGLHECRICGTVSEANVERGTGRWYCEPCVVQYNP